MNKQEYLEQVYKNSQDNHIWINWFWMRDDEFYINLWRTVYEMTQRNKIDIYSFWESSTMKIPWRTSFINITES